MPRELCAILLLVIKNSNKWWNSCLRAGPSLGLASPGLQSHHSERVYSSSLYREKEYIIHPRSKGVGVTCGLTRVKTGQASRTLNPAGVRNQNQRFLAWKGLWVSFPEQIPLPGHPGSQPSTQIQGCPGFWDQIPQGTQESGPERDPPGFATLS